MTRHRLVQEPRALNLYDCIRAVHCPPSWACFPEVADATGWDQKRHADAVAMSLYPSRGLYLRGFEIKTSRGDLLGELKNPEKAEAVAQYCAEWYLVSPEDVVRSLDELPAGWGWMVPSGKTGLEIKKPAERKECKEPGREFLAAMLRAARKEVDEVLQGYVRKSAIQEELAKAEERGKMHAAGHEIKRLTEQRDRLQKAVDEFKEATGMDLLTAGGYMARGKEMGEAMKLGRALVGRYHNGLPLVIRELEGLQNIAKGVAGRLKKVLEGTWEEKDDA